MGQSVDGSLTSRCHRKNEVVKGDTQVEEKGTEKSLFPHSIIDLKELGFIFEFV